VKEQFDFVLIDCPPSLGMLTLNGLSAADAVLIPVKTEFLSANGVVLFLETVRKVRARQNPRLQILGVLPTEFHSTHTHDNEVLHVLQTLLAEQRIPIFEAVNASTAFRKASAAGQPAVVLTPDLPGSQSYYKLADKIIAYAAER
jgi:chromosome partitioning protein